MLKLLMTAILLAAPAALRAQEAAPTSALADGVDARILEVKGDVTVYSHDNDEGAPADADLPLLEGDRIKTGAGAAAEIATDSGSFIRLRENTEFIFRNARRESTMYELLTGGLLAKVRKLTASEAMQVRTPTAVAAVRGTEFAIEIEPKNQETYVGVFDDGRIQVTSDTGGPAELLKPNQETRVMRGQRPMPAYQLHRLAKHRSFMRQHMRRRAVAISSSWKTLAPAERQELRGKILERMKQRRAFLREKTQQRRHDDGADRREELRKKNEEKMQKRRDEIRRRRAGQQP